MKNVINLLVCLFCTAIVFSQIEEDNRKKHALAIGAGAGISFDYSYQLNKTFALTAKYSFLKYSVEDYEYELDGEDLTMDGELDFGHADILLSMGGLLRLVVGAGYFTSSTVTSDMTFVDVVEIGAVVFTPDEVGKITIGGEWDQILPYVGVAIGRAVPKKGLGFGLEIGTYYDADGPTMTLDATGIIEGTKNQESLLQESFEDNKFLPYLNLRLAYAF